MRLVSLYGCVCRTNPASWSALRRAARLSIAQPAQYTFVVGPAAPHFHPDAEVDFAAKQPLHVLACGFRNALELRTLASDHDSFLTFPLHQNGRLNSAQAPLFSEAVDYHFAAVGQFFAEHLEQLLAQ